jgi:hypothetical protein
MHSLRIWFFMFFIPFALTGQDLQSYPLSDEDRLEYQEFKQFQKEVFFADIVDKTDQEIRFAKLYRERTDQLQAKFLNIPELLDIAREFFSKEWFQSILGFLDPDSKEKERHRRIGAMVEQMIVDGEIDVDIKLSEVIKAMK